MKHLLVLLLLGFSQLPSTPDMRVVTKVVDGDTIWVSGKNGPDEKIRLIGMDAHEIRNTAQKRPDFTEKKPATISVSAYRERKSAWNTTFSATTATAAPWLTCTCKTVPSSTPNW